MQKSTRLVSCPTCIDDKDKVSDMPPKNLIRLVEEEELEMNESVNKMSDPE
jgi:hypothetical protein